MAKSDNRYHVIRRESGWALKREGSAKAANIFPTKLEATNASSKFQRRNYDVIIHKTDGTISEWHKGQK